jgi:exodeoxyribonuclease-3
MPNGGRDKHDLRYKLKVYQKMLTILAPLATQPTILAGDFNIAHTPLDLYYPKQNENSTMFTLEERCALNRLMEIGYRDTFRLRYPEKKAYTWWPYMRALRERDIGWRIDYCLISQSLTPLLQDAFTARETPGSDHAPYGIVLDKKINYENAPVYKAPKGRESLF